MQFVILVYINNPRLEDKEKLEIFNFLKETVIAEIDKYIEDYETITSRKYKFYSNV